MFVTLQSWTDPLFIALFCGTLSFCSGNPVVYPDKPTPAMQIIVVDRNFYYYYFANIVQIQLTPRLYLEEKSLMNVQEG